jgi:cobalamin biosynthesis Mg chelatase CobN
MKYSIALVAAAATIAMARPKFLNTNFDLVPGQPFTLEFSGCETGCDIILQNGDSKNLKDVQTLIKDTKGPKETLTLSPSFPKDTYAFKIVANDGSDPNYSEQFQFEGADKPTETPTPTPEPTTSTSTKSTSTKESTTKKSSTMVSVTSSTPTPEPSTTTSRETTTGSDNTQETDVPDAAVRVGASHVTFAAAVVAVAGYFL